MKVPQIIVIVLLSLSLMYNLIKHGEDKGKYNFWVSIIDVGVTVGLLIWGGFFN